MIPSKVDVRIHVLSVHRIEIPAKALQFNRDNKEEVVFDYKVQVD